MVTMVTIALSKTPKKTLDVRKMKLKSVSEISSEHVQSDKIKCLYITVTHFALLNKLNVS